MNTVRAGADVIARWRADYPDTALDLTGADLRDINFQRVWPDNANLCGVDLTDTRLISGGSA